jgi:hypothetical protein
MTRDEIQKEIPEPDDVIQVARAVESYRKMVNYYYWRSRGAAEAEHTTSEAHRSLYDAIQAYKKQEFNKAREAAFAGMQGFETILNRPEYSGLRAEETLVEECLLGIKVWEEIHTLSGEPLPANFPLKSLWQDYQNNQNTVRNVMKAFKRLGLDDQPIK